MSSKVYPLVNSPLYRLRNRKKLAQLLLLEKTYFNKQHNRSYRHFVRIKDNGDERIIADPKGRLKNIQKRINKLLQRIETPEWVKSGKKGESYISNGIYHLGEDYVRTMDISHFYDSVKRDNVYKLFRDRFLMADDIATIMTNLVMDGNALPTGAPTSQLVAFWSYYDMFNLIKEKADIYGCKFTLYVDDLTLSSSKEIPYSLREEISEILHKYGLHANRKKDHYYRKGDFKIVTGYGFKDTRSDVINSRKCEIVRLYSAYKKGTSEINIPSLQGKLLAAKQVRQDLFPTLIIDDMKKK